MPRFLYSKTVKDVLKKMDHRSAVKEGHYELVRTQHPKDKVKTDAIKVRFTTSGLTIDNSWTLDQINKMAKTSKL